MKLIRDKLTVITSAFLLLLSPLAFSQEEAPAVEGEQRSIGRENCEKSQAS